MLQDGSLVPKGGFADIDRFDLPGLLEYKTLVLRRSPSGSRPPSMFRHVSTGRFYDVWQRDTAASPVVRHTSFGTPVQAGGRAPCDAVMATAKAAGTTGHLAAVFRAPVVTTDLNVFAHPLSWNDPGGAALLPNSAGTASSRVLIPNSGRYHVWLGGGFRSRLDVRLDGHALGSMRDHVNATGGWNDFGASDLTSGEHAITIRYSGPGLAPGSAADPVPLGPLALSPDGSDQPVAYLPVKDARSLCGKWLDWVEAVR
jgi:hypothetical protein